MNIIFEKYKEELQKLIKYSNNKFYFATDNLTPEELNSEKYSKYCLIYGYNKDYYDFIFTQKGSLKTDDFSITTIVEITVADDKLLRLFLSKNVDDNQVADVLLDTYPRLDKNKLNNLLSNELKIKKQYEKNI